MAKHANKKEKGNKNKVLIYIISGVLAVAIVAAVVIFITSKKSKPAENNGPTEFVEHKLDTFKTNDTIEIDDPELGHLVLETLKGAPKNTYINENFKTDENNIKEYYVDGKLASSQGVDLSEYQGEVDFEKLKEAGIDYVMLRIGGRGYGETGNLFDDTKFDQYYENATKAGLKVGAYFFSQSISTEEAKEEADYVIKKLDGRTLDYPVAYDFEQIEDDDARTDNVTSKELTQMAETFCDEIVKNGYKSIIYSNTYLMYYMYDLETMKNYDFWVADYGDYPSMYYGFSMWQYTKDGHIPGIDETLDLNVNFKNY